MTLSGQYYINARNDLNYIFEIQLMRRHCVPARSFCGDAGCCAGEVVDDAHKYSMSTSIFPHRQGDDGVRAKQ